MELWIKLYIIGCIGNLQLLIFIENIFEYDVQYKGRYLSGFRKYLVFTLFILSSFLGFVGVLTMFKDNTDEEGF